MRLCRENPPATEILSAPAEVIKLLQSALHKRRLQKQLLNPTSFPQCFRSLGKPLMVCVSCRDREENQTVQGQQIEIRPIADWLLANKGLSHPCTSTISSAVEKPQALVLRKRRQSG